MKEIKLFDYELAYIMGKKRYRAFRTIFYSGGNEYKEKGYKNIVTFNSTLSHEVVIIRNAKKMDYILSKECLE